MEEAAACIQPIIYQCVSRNAAVTAAHASKNNRTDISGHMSCQTVTLPSLERVMVDLRHHPSTAFQARAHAPRPDRIRAFFLPAAIDPSDLGRLAIAKSRLLTKGGQ
jgi:hypothetical protein